MSELTRCKRAEPRRWPAAALRWMAAAILCAGMMAAPARASAAFGASFNVNSYADRPDGRPGDGLCQTFIPGECTLRAAIQETNALPGDGEVRLGPGTYAITLAPGDDAPDWAAGDFDVTNVLVIVGAGAGATFLDGGGLDRVIEIPNSWAVVTISGVTIQNGRASNGDGGGIANSGRLTLKDSVIRNNRAVGGGGLANGGTLTLSRSTLSGNSALDVGGAIVNGGTMSLWDSTVQGSWATESGGAIYNTGSLTLNRTTVSGSSAKVGGGAYNLGVLHLNGSTVSGNTASQHGGGIAAGDRAGSSVTLRDSILGANAGPASPNCSGAIASGGNNRVGSTAGCTFNAALGDVLHADGAPAPSQAAASILGAGGTYVVQPGDNLHRLARRFGTTVEAIQRANGLTSTVILINQTLIIPGS